MKNAMSFLLCVLIAGVSVSTLHSAVLLEDKLAQAEQPVEQFCKKSAKTFIGRVLSELENKAKYQEITGLKADQLSVKYLNGFALAVEYGQWDNFRAGVEKIVLGYPENKKKNVISSLDTLLIYIKKHPANVKMKAEQLKKKIEKDIEDYTIDQDSKKKLKEINETLSSISNKSKQDRLDDFFQDSPEMQVLKKFIDEEKGKTQCFMDEETAKLHIADGAKQTNSSEQQPVQETEARHTPEVKMCTLEGKHNNAKPTTHQTQTSSSVRTLSIGSSSFGLRNGGVIAGLCILSAGAIAGAYYCKRSHRESATVNK